MDLGNSYMGNGLIMVLMSIFLLICGALSVTAFNNLNENDNVLLQVGNLLIFLIFGSATVLSICSVIACAVNTYFIHLHRNAKQISN